MNQPIHVPTFEVTVHTDLQLERPGLAPVILPAGVYVARAATIGRAAADPREFGLWPPSAAPNYEPNAKQANVTLELGEDGWSIVWA